MKQKIVNLYAGPGAGKSTTASLIFAEMKLRGYNVELVREYAKDLVWEYNTIPEHVSQLDIFTEQSKRQGILIGKVALIVTDSPLRLSTLYGTPLNLVEEEEKKYDSLNIEIVRTKPYQQAGRLQSEDEARKIDVLAREFTTYRMYSSKEDVEELCDKLEEWLNNE